MAEGGITLLTTEGDTLTTPGATNEVGAETTGVTRTTGSKVGSLLLLVTAENSEGKLADLSLLLTVGMGEAASTGVGTTRGGIMGPGLKGGGM